VTGIASITLTNNINEFSIDGTLGGNSDTAIPTERAVKTYTDTKVASSDITISTADNQLSRYDGIAKKIQPTGIVCDDSNNLTGVNSINVIGTGTDNHISRYNGTTGIQDSLISIDDTTGAMNFLPTTGLLNIQCDSIKSIYVDTNDAGSVRIGKNALSSITYNADGKSSVGIGIDAGKLTTGEKNVCIGEKAGESVGNNCVCVGYHAGDGASVYNNTIAIGYNAEPATHYYVQIGAPNEASNGGVAKVYSQIFCNESWRDGNTQLMSCDTTGNLVKTSIGVPSGGTHDVTWKGSINDTNSTLIYKVVNGVCFLKIPALAGVGKNSAGVIDNTGTELISGIRPSADTFVYMYVQDNSVHCLGSALIRTTGVITLYRLQVSGANLVYSNFSSNAGNNGPTHACTASYVL
jgi:hypothetical protein